MSISNDRHVIFGAGPIGLATVDALLERELPVRVVDRRGVAAVPEGVERVSGDASDPVFASEVSDGAAAVYQVLSPPYHRWVEEFPPLQASVVSAAQAAGARYVSFENLYMYGDPKGAVITEASPIQIHTRKGRVRHEMSEHLTALSDAGDVGVATARASDYFGPRATFQSQLGERAIGRALQGKSAQVVGDPDTRHSFTFTKDAGAVLATLGTDDRALGEVWHIPNAPARTLREMIGLVTDELGREVEVAPAPETMLKLIGLFNPAVKEMQEMLYAFKADYIAESPKFENVFGFGPTPIEQAISETVASWR